MIGPVFQIGFDLRKQGETEKHRKVSDHRDRVGAGADAKAEHAAGPQTDGGRQAFDLTLGSKKDGIDREDRDSDHRRRRKKIEISGKRYIERQEEHHQCLSAEDELKRFCELSGLEYREA